MIRCNLRSYEKPVLFERHAVGGEYQAGYNTVGAGKVETVFTGGFFSPTGAGCTLYTPTRVCLSVCVRTRVRACVSDSR